MPKKTNGPATKYASQKKWGDQNLQRYACALTKDSDKEIIEFIETAKHFGVSPAYLMKFGLQLAMRETDSFNVLNVYKADNGDEFVRIKRSNGVAPEHGRLVEVCKTKNTDSGIAYYTNSGEYIATGGIEIHDKLSFDSEFLYTHKSKRTK